MKVTVDRIENDKAVMLIRPDERDSFVIPIEYLPEVKEGDILNIQFEKDEKEREEAEKRVGNLLNRLKNKE